MMDFTLNIKVKDFFKSLWCQQNFSCYRLFVALLCYRFAQSDTCNPGFPIWVETEFRGIKATSDANLLGSFSRLV